MKSIAAGGHRLHSIQALCAINIILGQGQDEIPGPSFFIEIDAEHLDAGEGDFVEGEDEFAGGVWGYGPKAIDLFGKLGFLVLEAAFGAALALHGEAGFRHLITYGGAVPQGNQQKQHVILVEYVFAEDFYAVVLGADKVELLLHCGKFFKGERGRRQDAGR